MTKLTPEQLATSRSWLYDIFILAGVQINKFPDKTYSYWDNFAGSYNGTNVHSDAKIIVDMLKFRPMQYVKFTEIDDILKNFSSIRFSPVIDQYTWGDRVRKKPEMLARYLANFCAENKIYWSNTLSTPYEMDEIKNTIFGKALWDFQCFVTQGTTISNRAKTTKTPGQPPQNNYKSLGGLSDKVTILVGNPGDKKYINNSEVYCIEADKLGKNTPCIFVTPISNSGQAVSSTRAASVNLGSGNGYSDCKLWWDNLVNAQAFLLDCQTKFSNSKFQNLHVAKARPDSNGYFEVSTEFGNAYIKASRLNEEISEWLNTNAPVEDTDDEVSLELDEGKKKSAKTAKKDKNKSKKPKLTKAYKINDIDIYSSTFDKYRD